ncbi:UDP-glucose 4-epimerase [Lysobacter niastensis]|uniref:UDP-glucose 4-epimerase n=1 Tax=Lysobacter niastensis TaxID=380629 RepID=A0ABU1WCY7_9GAMM|nr:NAD-dependent epimerase/dehydratase family protein [Lysobacter niastensis]MDR7135220.1 UDP-glucose 4-epimerase [Lysobacter niastensis]
MRCLVLGGAGFIGSHLVDGLVSQGHQVRVFDRPQMSRDNLADHPLVEIIEGDFANSGEMADAIRGCDVCYHLISTTLPKSSNADPVFDLESNLVATVRMLGHAVEAGVRKVVFLSSGGTVYGTPQHVPIEEGHPTTPICSYGITKLAIEKYLELFRHLHGLDYTVLRLSNPYGERQRINASQGAVAVFLGKVLHDESVEIWGDGSVVRDYIHISDVVSAMLRCIDRAPGSVLNIGSGAGLSLNEVLDAIERVTGRTAVRAYKPGRAFDVPVSILDIGSARRELDWQPVVEFDQGIARMARWLQTN